MKKPSDALKSKKLCDGSWVIWAPKWEYFEDTDEGADASYWYDANVPGGFHSTYTDPTDSDYDLCHICDYRGLSVAAHLKRIYSREFFVAFQNEVAPFFKRLSR